jgi:hypothetical protein
MVCQLGCRVHSVIWSLGRTLRFVLPVRALAESANELLRGKARSEALSMLMMMTGELSFHGSSSRRCELHASSIARW